MLKIFKRKKTAHYNSNLIYLIDDDELLELVFDRILKKSYTKYKLTVFSSGQEALQSLENEHPKVIFLDYGLPGLDGAEVLEKIKASYPDIVVYILSGNEDPRIREELLSLGAEGFISKQYDGFEEAFNKVVELNV